MKAQIIKIFVVLLLTVVVFISACGKSNNTPSAPSQNNYEFEVASSNVSLMSSISYIVGNGSPVLLGPGYPLPITAADWTYNFQANSGEGYNLSACILLYNSLTMRVWKNGVIVDSTTTTTCAFFSGTLP